MLSFVTVLIGWPSGFAGMVSSSLQHPMEPEEQATTANWLEQPISELMCIDPDGVKTMK
jgi:hypothetical protein